MIKYLLILACMFGGLIAGAQNCNQYSLNFSNSVNGDYFERAHNTALMPANLSIEAWVRITSTPATGNFATIVAKYDNQTNAIQDLGGYMLAIDNNLKLYGVVQSDVVNVNTQLTSPTAISLNTWTHVAMTYTSATDMHLFINGTDVVNTSTGVVTMGSTSNPLEIGRVSNLAKSGYNFGYFIGQMDEVRIWNTALTQSTIAEWKDYSATEAHPSYSNAVANYRASIYYTYLDDSGPNNFALTAGGSASYTTFGPTINTQGAVINCSPSIGLSLDGVDDYVDCGGSTHFNLYPITAAINVKFSGTGFGVIMNKYVGGVNNGWSIWTNSGHVYAAYKVSNSVEVDTLDAGLCNDAQWHQMAYMVDATGGHLYKDGTQISALAWTGSPAACTTTEKLRIGRGGGSGTAYFNGAVENAMIYNTAYNASGIFMLRHYLNTNATAAYRFNNAATNRVVVDDVCNDYNEDNAYLYGSPATVSTPASLGQFAYSSTDVLQFTGTSYVVAETPVHSVFSPTPDMTVQFWFNTAAQTGTRAVLAAKGNEWSVELGTNNKLQAWFGDGTGTAVISKQSDNTLRDGFWHHVAVVFKTAAASEDVLLYIDGALQNNIATDNRASLNFSANAAEDISFGATLTQAASFAPTLNYSGMLDDASFFSTALTQVVIGQYRSRELNSTYSQHPSYNNMIGGFHFSSFGCSLDNDISPQSNWLLRNGVNTVSSVVPFGTAGVFSCNGRGVQFNSGTTSYAVFSNNSSYNFSNTDNYTIETWAKIPATQTYTTGGENVIIEKSDGSLTNYYLHIMSSGANAGKIHAGYQDGTWSGFYSATTFNDNKWHHLALVKSGSNMLLYVDGILNASATNTPAANFANTGRVIMGRNIAGTALFNGSVDETRIWAAAVSAATIQAWYDQTISSSHPDYASLAAEWTFDETSGTALFDASVNSGGGELGSGASRLSSTTALNKPRITSLSSNSLVYGSSLTINGRGLGATDSKVYFGPVWTNPITASGTTLTVAVPTAASPAFITVRPNNGCAYAVRSSAIFRPQGRCTVTPANTSFVLENTLNTVGSTNARISFADKQGDGSPDMTTLLNNSVNSTGNALNGAVAPGYAGSSNITSGTVLGDEDFDGDGKIDFAYGASTTSVALAQQTDATQTTTFTVQGTYTPGGTISDLNTGDVDADGRPDLLLAATSTVQTYYNASSTGTFAFNAPFSFALSGTPIQTGKIRTVDADGDGITDIVVAVKTASGWTIRVLKSTGSAGAASFTQIQSISFGSTQPDFELLDYNNDGITDFVVNDGGGLYLYSGANASPYFSYASISNSGSYGKVYVTDINGDGNMEVATVATSNLQSLLFFDATLTQVKSLALSDNFVDMASVDMNRDELSDLVITTATNSGRYFYRNTSAKVPTVTTITPEKAHAGENIVITGTNFDAVAANNVVYFGGAKGTITAGSATSLTVIVPQGVNDGTIAVTNGCALTGYSAKKFTQLSLGCGGTTLTSASFSTPFSLTSLSIASDYHFQTVQSGDLNNDGKPDLVVASHFSNVVPAISIFQNNYTSGTLSAASFAAPFSLTPAAYSWDVRLVDFDRDGKLDLGLSNIFTFSILRNKHTTGNLSAASFEPSVDLTGHTGANGRLIAIADFDGDGRPDLASGYYDAALIYRNLSTPGTINKNSFSKAWQYAYGGAPLYSVFGIAAGDLTGDGKPDLVVSFQNYSAPNTIFIYENTSVNGVISFAAPITISQTITPYEVAIDDVDGDGKNDLVFLGGGPAIYRNLYTSGTFSASSFAAPVYIASINNGQNHISMADIDGDGRRDIVGTPGYQNYVWQNISTPGNISFNTAVVMGFNNSPFGVAAVDLDGDGKKEVITSYNGNTQIVRNLSSKTFTTLVSSTTANGTVCDDGTWLNVYNPSNPSQLLLAIKPNGANLGNITATTYVDAGPGFYGSSSPNISYYMARHFVVQTSNHPVGNKTVRLYFTTAEFNALNTVDASISTISDLKIFKYDGPREDGVLDPSDATSKTRYTGAQLTFGTQYGVNYVEFDVPSFSEFWITGENLVVLPLKLLSFDAKAMGEDALLNWRTSEEKGADYFSVERSTDFSGFEEVGRTMAKGNGIAGETSYQYTDDFAFRAAHSDILYYRLKQVDKDGHFAYSTVRKVTAGQNAGWIRVVPNPANDIVHINLSKAAAADWQLSLTNAVGQVLRNDIIPAGTSVYEIPVRQLPDGVYYLELRSGDMQLREKVLVKHQ